MSGVFNALIIPDISEQIFLCLLFILCFTKICKIATISLKVEVWKKAGIMRYFHKIHVFSVLAIIVAVPFVASATEIMATKEYVDLTTVTKHQGTQGQMLQVDSSGDVALVTPSSIPTNNSTLPITSGAVYEYAEDKFNKLDGGNGATIGTVINSPLEAATAYTSAAAVAEYAVRKPATAAAGQVLTYDTGANANSRPVAKYIQVPVATGDPTSNTVNDVASIWLQ